MLIKFVDNFKFAEIIPHQIFIYWKYLFHYSAKIVISHKNYNGTIRILKTLAILFLQGVTRTKKKCVKYKYV